MACGGLCSVEKNEQNFATQWLSGCGDTGIPSLMRQRFSISPACGAKFQSRHISISLQSRMTSRKWVP